MARRSSGGPLSTPKSAASETSPAARAWRTAVASEASVRSRSRTSGRNVTMVAEKRKAGMGASVARRGARLKRLVRLAGDRLRAGNAVDGVRPGALIGVAAGEGGLADGR